MDSSDDRRVLLELFRATNGPKWVRNDGWDTNVSISSWFGVTTDEDGRVVALNLFSNNLEGPVPDSLGQLVNLKTVDISFNKLSGAFPDSLGQLVNLTLLDFSSNHLTGTIPASLGKLINLTTLNLYRNQLAGAIPDSVGQLVNLTTLNLLSNYLTGAIPDSFGKLVNLTVLNLYRNELNGAIPEFLGQLVNLTMLYLTSNHLSGAIPQSFGQLTNLTKLDLSNNRLTGTIPHSLGQLANLIRLDLSFNQLTGTIPESLGQLTNLKGLRLSFNQLDVISEEAARGLQQLRLEKSRPEDRRISLLGHEQGLYLKNNPWISPPTDVVDGGLKAIVGYWEAIERSGAIESWKLKVVLVGAVKAGKTSLINGMIHGQPHLCREDDRTKGVDVHVGKPCKPDVERKLELIFWDFAGHSEYSSTHQLFLSKGALNLLVVDLKRFSDEPPARGELVDVWLDALQCHVPGSNILVVATQTDRLTGDLEEKLGDLRGRVESRLRAQQEDLERARRGSSTSPDIQQSLIFHGVETVSSVRVESLMDLRLKLSTLLYTKRGMFPSVGQRRPLSWARVSAMLNAKQSGKDFLQQVSLVGAVKRKLGKLQKISAGVKFVQRTEAKSDWSRVVMTLNLENEVGLTEQELQTVFEDAVGQLVREGMILDSGEILYLEPVWINELLRTILDHDLANVRKDQFWKDELQRFSGGNTKMFFDLKNIHDNFPSTGILTVRYLRFLWRHVPEVSNETLFGSLIGTMSRYGIIFGGNPSGADSEHAVNASDNSAELFVPLNLPSKILESELEIETLLKHEFQKEIVYEISQTYVPPVLLGLLMARFLCSEDVEFQKCWSRGAVFALGEVLVLLLLNTPYLGEDEARIRVTLFGERFVSDIKFATKKVEREVTSVFYERFPGVFFSRKKGYPRDVDRENAVAARIDSLEEHLNKELSGLLQGLHQLEGNLQDVAKSCHVTLARLNKLQSREVPCPSLLIIRPAAAMLLGEQKRSLWAMVKDLGRRAKKLVCKDMRLCFLCPYDFSEVPCGLNGNGYPCTATRDWVTKIRPALKVTAVMANVAIKAASGLDLPLSDFLNGAKSYLGDELADRLPDDDAIERVLDGSSIPVEEGKAKMLVGEAYEELKKFIKEYECKSTERLIRYEELMQLVDDRDGGKVWISNENVQRWEEALA